MSIMKREWAKDRTTRLRLRKLEKIAGLKKERGFQWSELSVRAVAMVVVFAASWTATFCCFWVWTGGGHVYEGSLVPRLLSDNFRDAREGRVRGGISYMWMPVPFGKAEDGEMVSENGDFITEGEVALSGTYFLIYLDGDIALRIYAARLNYLAKEGWKSKCGLQPYLEVRNSNGEAEEVLTIDGYGFAWEFVEGRARAGVGELRGVDAQTECRVLVSYQRATRWTPYARDAVVNIPRGGIVPLVDMLLQRALAGLNHGDGGDSISIDRDVVEAMTQRLADSVISSLNYDKLENDLTWISFAFGPIQFLALNIAFVSVLLLVASLWFWWARQAVDIAMNLIPYVGFFGTLLGMGSALLVLGEANLSDPVSKAISLGPIGSKLALAIETTKWALVCYSVVSLLVLLRDSVFGQRENQNVAEGANGTSGK